MSTYGIITLSDFEDYMGIDFSAKIVDSDGNPVYSDTTLTAIISHWERFVTSYVRSTYSGKTPDDSVKFAVQTLCKIDVENRMITDGIIEKQTKTDPLQYWDLMLKDTLAPEKKDNELADVDSVEDFDS